MFFHFYRVRPDHTILSKMNFHFILILDTAKNSLFSFESTMLPMKEQAPPGQPSAPALVLLVGGQRSESWKLLVA